MMKKRVIVTGATSFIGIYLIKELLEEKYAVTAVIRPDSSRKDVLKSMFPAIQMVDVELSDLRKLVLPHKNYDMLYHIGWSSDFPNARYNSEGQRMNIDYCCFAVELAARYHCKKYLSVGSQAECGLVEVPICDTTRDNPITAYAEAKCIAYEKTRTLCRKYGIKQYWPRLLSAYGPYDRASTLISSCFNACVNNENIELTRCEQIWDYIYVSDVARALVAISEYGKEEKKYSIASGKGIALKEYIQVISEIMNYKELMNGIGKKKYDEKQVMFLVGDITGLEKDTGFKIHYSFENGVKNMKALYNNSENWDWRMI